MSLPVMHTIGCGRASSLIGDKIELPGGFLEMLIVMCAACQCRIGLI